jgi:hypothetical protein
MGYTSVCVRGSSEKILKRISFKLEVGALYKELFWIFHVGPHRHLTFT